MTTRRATLDEIEREIERRIEAATSGALLTSVDAFTLGQQCGAAEALRELRRWLTDEMRSRDGVSADDEGELRRQPPPEVVTRRR